MKIYRTKENNLINLEQVTMIYKDPDDGGYRVSFTSGITYEMPELDLAVYKFLRQQLLKLPFSIPLTLNP